MADKKLVNYIKKQLNQGISKKEIRSQLQKEGWKQDQINNAIEATSQPIPRPTEKPSRWYYLLPIVLGIIGGLVGYLLVKDKNREFAKKLLIIGVIITILWIVIQFLLSFLTYFWFMSMFNNTNLESSDDSGLMQQREQEIKRKTKDIMEKGTKTIGISNPKSNQKSEMAYNPMLNNIKLASTPEYHSIKIYKTIKTEDIKLLII